MDHNRVIGKDGGLPWRLPDDLQHFKALTMGHPVVMGRKTYESIGRPLPKRRNFVLTRRAGWGADGVETAGGVEELRALIRDEKRVFVMGGEAVYAAFLPVADRLYLTQVDTEVRNGDARFPDWPAERFRLLSREPHPVDERHPHAFVFEEYAKIDPAG